MSMWPARPSPCTLPITLPTTPPFSFHCKPNVASSFLRSATMTGSCNSTGQCALLAEMEPPSWVLLRFYGSSADQGR
eukprot:11427722-Prorocentrum_lima.AAC.1